MKFDRTHEAGNSYSKKLPGAEILRVRKVYGSSLDLDTPKPLRHRHGKMANNSKVQKPHQATGTKDEEYHYYLSSSKCLICSAGVPNPRLNLSGAGKPGRQPKWNLQSERSRDSGDSLVFVVAKAAKSTKQNNTDTGRRSSSSRSRSPWLWIGSTRDSVQEQCGLVEVIVQLVVRCLH